MSGPSSGSVPLNGNGGQAEGMNGGNGKGKGNGGGEKLTSENKKNPQEIFADANIGPVMEPGDSEDQDVRLTHKNKYFHVMNFEMAGIKHASSNETNRCDQDVTVEPKERKIQPSINDPEEIPESIFEEEVDLDDFPSEINIGRFFPRPRLGDDDCTTLRESYPLREYNVANARADSKELAELDLNMYHVSGDGAGERAKAKAELVNGAYFMMSYGKHDDEETPLSKIDGFSTMDLSDAGKRILTESEKPPLDNTELFIGFKGQQVETPVLKATQVALTIGAIISLFNPGQALLLSAAVVAGGTVKTTYDLFKNNPTATNFAMVEFVDAVIEPTEDRVKIDIDPDGGPDEEFSWGGVTKGGYDDSVSASPIKYKNIGLINDIFAPKEELNSTDETFPPLNDRYERVEGISVGKMVVFQLEYSLSAEMENEATSDVQTITNLRHVRKLEAPVIQGLEFTVLD